MNIRRAFLSVLTVFVIAGTLSGAPPAEAVVIHYRSIGTNTAELFNAGAASVGMGQTKVTFAFGSLLPETVGRGDEIVIDDEELYVLSRDNDTQLTLQTPAAKGHLAEEFAIRRAYTSIQAWVNDRNGNLVREDRLEVGVCYNDGPFSTNRHWALAHIRGSRTDPDHFMWLTAAETAQHKGAAGKGVILDGLNRARCGILIEDDYTRVDGLELRNFGHWFAAPGAVVVRYARGVALERLLVHDFDVRHRESVGINGGVHSDFVARNCIIYNGGTAGIATRWKTSKAIVENCTVFGMQGKGVDEGHGLLSAVNTLSMSNRGDFAIRRGTQSNNISSDGTAAGPGSMVFLKPSDQFVSIAPGSEDFHLTDTSAAVDAGKNLSAAPVPGGSIARAPDAPATGPDLLDIDGTDRAEEDAWDIGADEVESAPEGVWYVDPEKSGDGTSWKTAFATIQQALDAAPDGEQVWVKEGLYALTSELIVDKPVSIYGGFSGKEKRLAARNWKQRPTTLDGQGTTRCMFLNHEGILVNGLVFKSGSMSTGMLNMRRGGAIHAAPQARFTIEDCLFTDNRTPFNSGGAIFTTRASGAVRSCEFSDNMAGSGGAIYAEASTLDVAGSIFTGNSANTSGTTSGGGAIYNKGSTVIVTNCNFVNNQASGGTGNGGAIYSFYNPRTEIVNSILWGNLAANGEQVYDGIYNGAKAQSLVRHSDIDQDGLEGINGNIRKDPMFVDPLRGDFRLQPLSPCIDAGTMEAVQLPEFDVSGGLRVLGKSVDMGAFESGN